MPRKPGQAQKDLVVPPVAAGLRREALVQSSTLRCATSEVSGTYTEGRPRSPSHFGISYDKVELVPEDSRQHLADRPVVLMGIVARRRKDEVGCACARHLFEDVLDAIPDRGKPAFRQFVQVNAEVGRREEARSAPAAPRDDVLRSR